MDPVTHAVLGRSLEYLRQRGPAEKGRGMAVVLGALSPDIDAVLMPLAFDRYLAAHEVGTHSAIGAIVCGMLAASLTRLVRRGSRFGVLVAASSVGAMSHIAGDLLAGASIRVAWPFDDTRVINLGVFAMGDPVIVASSVVTVIAWWIQRGRRRQWAIALLILFAAGAVVKSWSRLRALDAYHAMATPGSEVAAAIEPVSASLFAWRVFDRTPDVVRAWHADARGPVRLLLAIPRVPAGDAEAREAVDRSRRWDTTRTFLRAHEFAFATVARDAVSSDSQVMWSDIRYCESAASCVIRSGGELSQSGELRLLVHVGSLRQVR
jgi:membrane-bound metal-dependent hydrolase YbcI (DUF457 family)